MRSSAVLLLASALACTSAPPGPAAGERFPMRRGQSVAVRGTPVTLSFEGIVGDSRCAIDVMCIQAGEARASFLLATRGNTVETFELDSMRQTSAVVGGWRVTLLSVSPAPRSTVRIAPEDYVVEVTVSKGNSPPS